MTPHSLPGTLEAAALEYAVDVMEPMSGRATFRIWEVGGRWIVRDDTSGEVMEESDEVSAVQSAYNLAVAERPSRIVVHHGDGSVTRKAVG